MKGIYRSKIMVGFIVIAVGMSYINGQQVSNEKKRIARESEIKIVTNVNK